MLLSTYGDLLQRQEVGGDRSAEHSMSERYSLYVGKIQKNEKDGRCVEKMHSEQKK
jgi:hypothetical protein